MSSPISHIHRLVISLAMGLCGCTGVVGGTTEVDVDSGTPPGGSDAGGTPTDAGTTDAGPTGGLACSSMDPTSLMPQGATQLASFCARGYTDPVSTAFCTATPPTLTSLADVLHLVGMGPINGPFTGVPNVSAGHGNPGFILTAQSTGLTSRQVSQINPRTIFFTPPLSRGRVTGALQPNPQYVAAGFSRGDEAIELLAKDPTMNGGQGGIRFFLVKYQLACNAAPGGCTPGDLYTPAGESGFTSWSLYDDQDLKDTTLDCLQCHQPGGPGTARMLRMQELERPWQHWMYNDAINVAALRADFHAAHGTTEPYGGIPGAAMDMGDVQQLEAFVENNGFMAQPNEFQGVKIAAEVAATGSSATWQTQFQAAESGQFIPVPYFNSVATDPTLVQPLVTQYASVMAGTLPAAQLGDLGAVYNLAQQQAMTQRPAAGLTGQQILVQVCQQCHNSHLDQTLSRARFNVETLATLPRYEKDEAIRRINLPTGECGQMPPTRFRDLDPSEIALVQAQLMQ